VNATPSGPAPSQPSQSGHSSYWTHPTPHGSSFVIVGGAEDRIRQKVILRRFVELSGGSDACILVVCVASETPDAIFEAYRRALEKLGVREVRSLLTTTRDELRRVDGASLLKGVTGIYFSGGDQLRISSILGGTEFFSMMQHQIQGGCVLGGTSAGASAMSDSMIIGWEPSDQPLPDNIRMSSGLGILRHMVIDQHFSERNRLSRLITAVAYHPGYLGVGIDEDTAAIIGPDGVLRVLGSGTVTIVDGSEISHCTVAEAPSNHAFSVIGLKIHVLDEESAYDLNERRPTEAEA